MDEHILRERIARVRQLLMEIHHVPLATVSEDGSPHNSPVFMAFDENLNGYWASDMRTLHSKNIARTGQVFLVIFDSREGHGGLYIRAMAKVLEDPKEAEHGYQTLKRLKEQMYGNIGSLDLYIGDAPQRMYCAEPQQLWVNRSERDAEGRIIRDLRYEISPDQLQ